MSSHPYNLSSWRATGDQRWGQEMKATSLQDSPPSEEQNPAQEEERVAAAIAEGRRIYVGNLLYSAQPSDITSFFASAGFEISRLSMSIDPFTKRNPSYCFVELPSKDAAEQALKSLSGSLILGRPIKVKPCVKKSREAAVRGRWAPQHLAPDSSSRRWEEQNASEVVDMNNPTATQQGKRLFVGGLPRPLSQAQSEEMIRDLFTGFHVTAISKVISPRPHQNHWSGNKYYAFVDFETMSEARKARNALNGQFFQGTQLLINFAKGEPRKAGP